MAFRWTESGGMAALDCPEGYKAAGATAVSADGLTTVGFARNSVWEPHAFLWGEGGRMIDIGMLPGDSKSTAWGVTGNGSIVVGNSGSGTGRPFIWDADHGIRSLQDVLRNDYGLDLEGWLLRGGALVSDDGMVFAGNGNDSRGNQRGWIATIPEPATLLLLGLGGLALVRRRGQA